MQHQPDSKDRRFATTLARGLAVLRAFRASDDGLGNAEIAERTGLPKSTVSRLTFTLQSLGYLTHARRMDRYRPGPALLALGNIAQASISFVDLAAPLMQKLANATSTLSLLLVRDNNKLLVLRTWRPALVSSLWLETGHRLPFVGTSSGHALLAAMPQPQFDQLRPDLPDPVAAHHARDAAYAQVITQGYVITPPEHYFAENIHAVSKPFFARDLAEPVVFTCGAMPKDLTLDRMTAEVGPKLNAAIQELERIMGQPPSITLRSA